MTTSLRIAVTDLAPPPQGRLPTRPLFAVGDIHGHAMALEAMLAHLHATIEADFAGVEVELVYLGDYVDRGPDPKEVIDLVRLGLGLNSVRETALMGNHDRFLIDAAGLRGVEFAKTDWAQWLANGGGDTLAGLGGFGVRTANAEKLREALGPENTNFLCDLSLQFLSGEILCVHAGIDPTKPLHMQNEDELLWIRSPFLTPAERDEAWGPGVTVVHGHTPNAFGIFAQRIGVDTGGYATGIFTAVEISERGVRFHHLDCSR